MKRGWPWSRVLREAPEPWEQPDDEVVRFAAQLEAGQRVLDLGCGVGRHTVYLAHQGFEVHASDIAADGLRETLRRLRVAGVDGAVLHSDMTAVPYPDAAFDAAIAINVIYHGYRADVETCLAEVRRVAKVGDRALVTTLTKRFAEDLTEYYEDLGVRVRYMHSDIDALERVRIIRDLRSGVFDVLIGINLLREGLDLPEVALVAVFDADKEGFLRSETSLIQTSGRAARHINGRVIMYADRITDSMRRALDEMDRRRSIQIAYNEANGVVPRSISRRMDELLEATAVQGDGDAFPWEEGDAPEFSEHDAATLDELRAQMHEAAQKLEFERAAEIRDKILAIERRQLGLKPSRTAT